MKKEERGEVRAIVISHPFFNYSIHKQDRKNREMAFLSSSILALFFPLIFHHFLLDSQKNVIHAWAVMLKAPSVHVHCFPLPKKLQFLTQRRSSKFRKAKLSTQLFNFNFSVTKISPFFFLFFYTGASVVFEGGMVGGL